MKKNQDEGFTLIELLIVIVILGILATVVVFAVGGITNRGQQSACDTDRATLEVAVEAYFAKAGHYPTAQTDMTSGDYKFLRDVSDLYDLSSVTSAGDLVITGADC
jgi:general secretion pathway protein G